jgi:hypothetical protein
MLDFIFRYLLKPTGIAESISDFKMKVFPNPAADYIEINLEGRAPTGEFGIEVFNTLGELVLQVIDLQGVLSPLHRTNISHLPVGMYFIKIGNCSEKLMVVR